MFAFGVIALATKRFALATKRLALATKRLEGSVPCIPHFPDTDTDTLHLSALTLTLFFTLAYHSPKPRRSLAEYYTNYTRTLSDYSPKPRSND